MILTNPQSKVTCSYPLASLTTFKTVAYAEKVIFLTRVEQLNTIAKTLNSTPFIVLGSGSNVLFTNDYPGTVVINQLTGSRLIDNSDKSVVIEIAAGENWHQTILSLSKQHYYGLENLALIPGTVGAAPVQNIGAYGVEVADFIKAIQVFDLQKQCHQVLTRDDCDFHYRDSRFKTPEWRQRYIITAVQFELSKQFAPNLAYQTLCSPTIPTSAESLITRVIAIRQQKLPDPNELANAGSFFKNPIISQSQLTPLQQQYPDVPYFRIDTKTVKIPAAWLIEQSGYKGKRLANGAGVYQHHALILVNYGQAHGRDIANLAKKIIQSVKQQFKITLVPEVRLVGQH